MDAHVTAIDSALWGLCEYLASAVRAAANGLAARDTFRACVPTLLAAVDTLQRLPSEAVEAFVRAQTQVSASGLGLGLGASGVGVRVRVGASGHQCALLAGPLLVVPGGVKHRNALHRKGTQTSSMWSASERAPGRGSVLIGGTCAAS